MRVSNISPVRANEWAPFSSDGGGTDVELWCRWDGARLRCNPQFTLRLWPPTGSKWLAALRVCLVCGLLGALIHIWCSAVCDVHGAWPAFWLSSWCYRLIYLGCSFTHSEDKMVDGCGVEMCPLKVLILSLTGSDGYSKCLVTLQ